MASPSSAFDTIGARGNYYSANLSIAELQVCNLIAADIHDRGGDIARDKLARQRVVEASRACVAALNDAAEQAVKLPFLFGVGDKPQHYERTFTRADLSPRIGSNHDAPE